MENEEKLYKVQIALPKVHYNVNNVNNENKETKDNMKATRQLTDFPILIEIDDDTYLMIEDREALGSGKGIFCRIGSIGEWDCVSHSQGEDALNEIERLKELEESWEVQTNL